MLALRASVACALLALSLVLLASPTALAKKQPDAPLLSVANNVVVRINAHIFDNAPKPPSSTPMSRVNSITFIAMHDALNSLVPIYKNIYSTVNVHGANKRASPVAAVLAAFNTTRVIGMQTLPHNYQANRPLWTGNELDPYLKALSDFMTAELAKIQDSRENIALGRKIGEKAALNALAAREEDGYKVPAPIQDADCNVLGQWCSWTQKDLPANARGAGYPNWGNVQTFALDDASDFTAPPPPKPSSAVFLSNMNITKQFGKVNSPFVSNEVRQAAHIWSLGAGGELGARLVDDIFAQSQMQMSLHDTVALMGRMYVGNADALINNLYNKYKYNSWRPWQAINQLDPAAQWNPYLPTPINQEYPCGHCEGTAGALYAVQLSLGFDQFAWGTSTLRAPGMQLPGGAVFGSFSDVFEHVNRARVIGGMHFTHSCKIGSNYGQRISQRVFETLFVKRDQ